MRFKRALSASMAGIMALSSAYVLNIGIGVVASAATSLSVAPYGTEKVIGSIEINNTISGKWTGDSWFQIAELIEGYSISSLSSNENIYIKVNLSGISDLTKNAAKIYWNDESTMYYEALCVPASGSTIDNAYCYIPISNIKLANWGFCGNYQSGELDSVTINTIQIVEVVDSTEWKDSNATETNMGTDYSASVNPGIGGTGRILSGTAKLKIQYTVNGKADWHQIYPKYMNGNWDMLDTGVLAVGQNGSMVLELTANDISNINEYGLVLQGYDVTITKVLYDNPGGIDKIKITGAGTGIAEYGDDDVTLSAGANGDATVTFDASTEVTWKSSNTNVATVGEKTGVVKFVGVGTAEIAATYTRDESITDSVTFTVSEKQVTATITAPDVTVSKDDVAESDLTGATAAIDGLETTDYTVTKTIADDKKSYTVKVELTEAAATKYKLTGDTTKTGNINYSVTGVTLDNEKLSIVAGKTAELAATITPTLATGTVEWTSDKTDVATVKDGVVTAVAEGTATITAKVGDKSATCTVTVTKDANPAAKVELDKTTAEVTTADKTLKLTATVTAEDTSKACTDSVTWKSSDEKVATVSGGTVTIVGKGTATITAAAGDQKAECALTVKAVEVSKVELDATTAELEVGGTKTLKATVTPDNAEDKTVTWTSSDEKIATVKDGVVTAAAAGEATITAKAGEKTATCKVTVTEPKKEEITSGSSVSTEATDLGTGWDKSVSVSADKAKATEGTKIRVQYSTGDAEYHQVKISSAGEGWPVLTSSATIDGKAATANSYGCYDVTGDGEIEITLTAEEAAKVSADGIVVSGYDITVEDVLVNVTKEADVKAGTTKVENVITNTDKDGNITDQYAIFSISAEDAKKYDTYMVTVTRSADSKKVTQEVTEYSDKIFYEDGNGVYHEVNAADGAHLIAVDLTGGTKAMGTITVSIEPVVG